MCEAVFEPILAPQYTLSLSINNANWGTTSGSGTYNAGTTVTAEATPNSGYSFIILAARNDAEGDRLLQEK
jgi:beta-galactosidase GanA